MSNPSDQLLFLTERIQEIERKQPKKIFKFIYQKNSMRFEPFYKVGPVTSFNSIKLSLFLEII